MKKTVTLASLIAAFGMAATIPANADMKVGIVDMNKVFTNYYETKNAENRIKDAQTEAKKELDDRMESYKKDLDDINKLNDDIAKPELSKEAKDKKSKERDEKIAEAKTLDREIAEFRSTREKQLQEQVVRMRAGLVEKINKVIQDKVKSDQFDLVLDKSGNSIYGVPVVLYSKDSADFSDEVIAALNKDKPKDGATPSPSPEATPGEKASKKSK